jgi:TonB family protein
MESREAIALLVQATLVGSAAIALVLLARQPLRRAFGARAAYAAWWLVPAALVALAIPSAPSGDVAVIGVHLAAPLGIATGFAGREAGFSWQPWALGAWACGAIAFALLMAAAQAKFRASLGALRPHGDAWRAEHVAEGLPATVGVLAPRIVVPADFESRYDARQRDLVLAHERTHVVRGDAWANLAVAALRCLCWFNPLAHVAARRFRHDQELACDAIVVARHPQSRRAYGDALFQAQFGAEASPLACHFGFGHPLKERIAMLREPIATRRRRIAGNAAVAVLASAAAFAAWASQPQDAASNGSKTAASDVVGTIKINPSDFPVGEVRIPPPVYPKDSVDAGSGGTIMLLIDVAADGSITGVSVESATTSDRRLVAAAAKNAWDWKFTPQVKDGKPVAGRVRVPVTFSPAEPKASAQG